MSETAAVALALELALAAAAGVRFHVYHASVPRSFELVAAYRALGVQATAETCPHYLLLAEADMDRLGALGKINPPLRAADAVAGVWACCALRQVTTVASDHAPWPLERKSDTDNIFANASGAPGVETLLPLVYPPASRRDAIGVVECARLLSEAPARTFNLFPRKGQIAVGSERRPR